MEGMLCCIFNYAPLYRKAIYTEIDKNFDAEFCFSDEVIEGHGNEGIAPLDWSIFRRPVTRISNKMLLGKHPWRSGILKLARQEQYSAFLITGDFNWAYLPFILLCRIRRKKVYAWGHGLKSFDKNARARRWFYNHLDGYFIYGERGKKRMTELGIPAEKFRVIYNSLTDKVDRQSNKLLSSPIFYEHFGNADPTLLFVGRLTSAKRPGMLIEAMRRLRDNGLDLNLVIVGDGPEASRLKALIISCNLSSRVWIYGATYDEEEVATLFYNAAVVVSPGNVGLMAIQAMQYGTPVISHDNFETQMPESEAIIEGKTGLTFKEGDVDDLCRAIRQWLAAAGDRQQVRQACYEVIESHWNSTYQIGLLKSVLG